MGSQARRAFELRLQADAWAAGEAVPVPGGTLLRTPELPDSWDLNQVVLAPGASALPLELVEREFEGYPARRLTLFEPVVEEWPDGWQVEESLLMAAPEEKPPWPEQVVLASAAELREARERMWAAETVGDPAVLTDMQELFGSFPGAQLLAVFSEGEPVGWATVANGGIDDVWVFEEHRGRGLGRALTAAAVAAGGWYLWTARADPRPQGLYRSLGFREIGRVVQLTRQVG